MFLYFNDNNKYDKIENSLIILLNSKFIANNNRDKMYQSEVSLTLNQSHDDVIIGMLQKM